MREIKRKRPWETHQEEVASSVFDKFFHQLILSTFITIGIFIALNTDNNTHITQFINTQLTKNIELHDVSSLMDYIKDTLGIYRD